MPPQEADKYRLPESTKLWKLKYDAVRAIKKSAHKNMVLVEAKQRWNWRFMAWDRSILNFPGVDGNSSSCNEGIFILKMGI
jgi:uncharacterized NAD(P)/FAD-binding protein YdhS